MKKTLRVLSSAALAGSILFTQAAPAFAKQVNFYPSELKLVETVSTVNVTYDKNCSDSVKVPDSQSAETETAVTISFETPVRDGYTFAGWSENKNANENDQLLHGGDAFTVKGNTRLYAIWVKDQAPAAEETKPAPETNEEPEVQDNTVTVQEETQEESANEAVSFQLMLDTHGGTMSIDHVNSDEHGVVTVPAEKPVKNGFIFLGWAEDPESGIVKHQPGETFTINNDMKLYAVWQAEHPVVQATLAFDANGGTGGPTSIKANVDGTVTIPTLIPVRNGYKFLGWSADAKATKATYSPGQTIKINADFKLYAVWQDNKSVNTGVHNNTMFYAFTALAAAAFAGSVFMMKKNTNK